MEKYKQEMIGRVFNRLTVLSYDEERSLPNRKYFHCQCSCDGNIKSYRSDLLKSGNTESCSCLQKEVVKARKTHGMSRTTEYFAWQTMKDRCYNEGNPQYHDYGGRGITVCDRWLESFENFFKDMGYRPAKGYDLDKINNNLPYSKDNCRWAQRDFGNHNKRSPVGCTSDYRGVYYDKSKNKFVARLYKNKIKLFHGYFVNEYDAAVAYDDASELHYGDRPNKT